MAANRFGQDHKDYVATDAKLKDPGDDGTVKCEYSFQVLELVSSAADDVRTMAAPTMAVGAELFVVHKTDDGAGGAGGAGVVAVTFAAAVNDSGNTVVTFTDTGDWAIFRVGYAVGTVTKAWRYVAGEGVTLS